jgi:DNA mismatch repair protein MutS
LAWAIVEHIALKIGARTLFATHYHQLTDLAQRHEGVCNMNVAVREWQDEIVFLHKIVDGGTDRSYGIHVARLAGVPDELIVRAKSILRDLEEDAEGLAPRISARSSETRKADGSSGSQQLSLFAAQKSAIERELEALDLDRLAPIDALLKLKQWREQL